MPNSIVDQVVSLDIAASIDPIIVSADPEIRRTSLSAFQVLQAGGPGGGFRSVLDTVNKRWGFSTIDGTFTPETTWDAETEGGDFFIRTTVYSNTVDDENEWVGRRARGTKAAPLAILAGDSIFEIEANGYDGAAFSLETANIEFQASENYAPGAHGTRQVFRVADDGTSIAVERMRLHQSGALLIDRTTRTAGLERLRVGGPALIDITDLKALRVTDVALGDFFINDTVNRRIGIEGIAGQSFNPSFPLHAEYQSTSPLWMIDIYGSSADNFEFVGRKAQGTKAAPAALLDDDDMWEFSARGYDGVSFSDQQAVILFEAAGPWTALSHGTRAVHKTTPQGSTAMTEVLVLGDDGSVIVTGGVSGFVGAVAGEKLRVNGAYRQQVASQTAFRLDDGAGNDRVVFDTLAPSFFGFSNAPGTFTPSFFMHGESEGPDPAGLFIDAYGAAITAQMQFRKANGTKAAPSGLLSGDLMGVFGVRGYGTTGFSGASRASVRFNATEGWTDTAQGAEIRFATTPNGSASAVERYNIQNNGNLRMNGDHDFFPQVDDDGRVGTPTNRFTLVRAVTVTAGDLLFENGWRFTEDYEDDGLVLRDRMGREMLAVRKSGFYIRGRKIKALTFEEESLSTP